MSAFFAYVESLGRGAIGSVSAVGRTGYLGLDALRALRKVSLWGPHLLGQMARVGAESVPIALFIAPFKPMPSPLRAPSTPTFSKEIVVQVGYQNSMI